MKFNKIKIRVWNKYLTRYENNFEVEYDKDKGLLVWVVDDINDERVYLDDIELFTGTR